MTVPTFARPTDRIPALLAELDGIRAYTDAKTLELKSKDYFWYSPMLAADLADRVGDVVLRPADEPQVIRIAAACARHRVPLTVRGGGTGNYGQCVPLAGGVILEITDLDQVLAIRPGSVATQAGIRIAALEKAVAATGQELLMWPSTRRFATIGGFIAGGSAGIGSIRHGVLADPGNVGRIRVITVEETPRAIELTGADIQKVHHAYGTNGIITELDVALAPAVDWRHVIALFPDYMAALRFGAAAAEAGLDLQLLTAVDRRFAPYYRALGDRFPSDRDAVFAIVGAGSVDRFGALAGEHGGAVTLAMTEAELHAARLTPAYECAFNHTTLQALKLDRSWTYLQAAYPRPLDPALVARQMHDFGDEVLMHHEFAKAWGGILAFALPLVRWSTPERMQAIIARLEADGCIVFNPHVVTIEEGGMKTIDEAQIAFKRIADPYGLMNPGKTLGWTTPPGVAPAVAGDARPHAGREGETA